MFAKIRCRLGKASLSPSFYLKYSKYQHIIAAEKVGSKILPVIISGGSRI